MERGYDRRFPTSIIAILAVTVTIIVVVMIVFAYLVSRNPYYGYSGYYGGMMGGFGGFGMLFMIPIGLIILVIIGYAIWRGFGWGRGCCGGGRYGYYGSYDTVEERETTLEILRRRYANGEISKEQFEQMKKELIG